MHLVGRSDLALDMQPGRRTERATSLFLPRIGDGLAGFDFYHVSHFAKVVDGNEGIGVPGKANIPVYARRRLWRFSSLREFNHEVLRIFVQIRSRKNLPETGALTSFLYTQSKELFCISNRIFSHHWGRPKNDVERHLQWFNLI
jgi:hypothetical protein